MKTMWTKTISGFSIRSPAELAKTSVCIARRANGPHSRQIANEMRAARELFTQFHFFFFLMNVTTIVRTAYSIRALRSTKKKNRKFAARIYLVRTSVAVSTNQRQMKKNYNLFEALKNKNNDTTEPTTEFTFLCVFLALSFNLIFVLFHFDKQYSVRR